MKKKSNGGNTGKPTIEPVEKKFSVDLDSSSSDVSSILSEKCVSETSFDHSGDESSVGFIGSSDENADNTISVPSARSKMDRTIRKDFCFFCKSYVRNTSFSRHLERNHSDQHEVQNILKLPEKTKERRRALKLLRQKGNFAHNKRILKLGRGTLKVAHRPKKKIEVQRSKTYRCCKSCLAFVSKKEFWRHSCPSNIYHSSSVSCNSLLHSNPSVSKFLDRLRDGDIASTIKQDSLIMRYVKREICFKGEKCFEALSNQVRNVASFLLHMRSATDILSLNITQVLTPEMFNELMKEIKRFYNYRIVPSNEEYDCVASMDSPSSLVKLGQTLTKLAELLKLNYLKRGEKKNKKKTKDVLLLLQKELLPIMNISRENMRCSKSGLPEILPSAEQIDAFKSIVNAELSLTKSNGNERNIKEATLSYLIMFNKRRPTEVAKLTKSRWDSRHQWKRIAENELEKLDDAEKILIKQLEVVYILGKGRRYVPIIFPPNVVEVVNWLSARAGKFIFSNEKQGYIRGNDAMRNIAKKAKISGQLGATKFRKLAATTLQVCIAN